MTSERTLKRMSRMRAAIAPILEGGPSADLVAEAAKILPELQPQVLKRTFARFGLDSQRNLNIASSCC